MKRKLLFIFLFTVLVVNSVSLVHAYPDVWSSKLLGTFDDENNDNFFAEILDADNNPPNFDGDLTKYCVKVEVTTSSGLDAGDGIEFRHSNDGSTDAVTIGTLDSPSVGTYWVNSTDSTLLSQVEHDGTQEWIHCVETGTIVGQESLVADVYVYFEYTPVVPTYSVQLNETLRFKAEKQTRLIGIFKITVNSKLSFKREISTLFERFVESVKVTVEQSFEFASSISTIFEKFKPKAIIRETLEFFASLPQSVDESYVLPVEEDSFMFYLLLLIGVTLVCCSLAIFHRMFKEWM